MLSLSVNVALSARQLSVRYQNAEALSNVNFEIPRGACCAVVGPNGAGKSTLLKCALGLVKPASGAVQVHGQTYCPKTQRIAYIPQRTQVDWDFPATVFDAVRMGIENIPPFWSKSCKEIKMRVLSYLDCVGMANLAQRPLRNLSGGQQQRVFFARALAQRAELYLMDEPFSGVDVETEEVLASVLQEICELGKTVVVIHHNLQFVHSVFSHVLLLNKSVIACGSMTDVWTPENLKSTFTNKVASSNHGGPADLGSFEPGQQKGRLHDF